MKVLPQPANNVVYFHFKFHQNRTRFSTVFQSLFIHSLVILMSTQWISDHLTSTFRKFIILKLCTAGHWFFQWCLRILKTNISKIFSSLGEFLQDLWAKEVFVWFFFAIVIRASVCRSVGRSVGHVTSRSS